MRHFRSILISVYILALALRVGLALVNREANDDHMQVITMIADGEGVPDASQCAECFQPKLFYVVNAAFINVLGIDDPDSRIVAVQLHNLVFVFFILLFLWKYLRHQPFSPGTRLAVFAVLALNPALTGINAQVTNDTLLILWGVLTIHFTDRFLATGSSRAGAWLILFAVLAAVTKGSGLVVAGAAGFAMFIRFAFDAARRKAWLRYGLYLLAAFILVVPFAGGYYQSYVKWGTPFPTGMGISPWKGETSEDREPFRWRPGVVSTGSAFLTFRWGNMVDQPYIGDDPDDYVLHRTSLWSQLYGRALFTRFAQHPPSWQNTDGFVLNTGRAALALGLVPLLLCFAGFFRATGQKLRRLFRLTDYIRSTLWVHMIFVFAFLAFIIMYSRDYPDFSTMKFVFLLPALPAFAHVIANGLDTVKNPLLHRIATWSIVALCVIHVIDAGLLIIQLKG